MIIDKDFENEATYLTNLKLKKLVFSVKNQNQIRYIVKVILNNKF